MFGNLSCHAAPRPVRPKVMTMRKPTLSLLAAAAAALILSACGSTAPADTSAPVETASADGQVAAASCLPDCSVGGNIRPCFFSFFPLQNLKRLPNTE